MQVGKIVNTHGLRGEVKLTSWCDSPALFSDFDYIYIDGQKVQIKDVRFHKGTVILKLDGVNDITAAELLKNKIAEADKAQLGELPEGSFFIVDLIGLKVQTDDGRDLGILIDVLQTGSNDVYVVKSDEKELLLPAVKQCVLNTDIEIGIMTVHMLEGLEDLVDN